MKINISIEATPEEVREVLGLCGSASEGQELKPCFEKFSKVMEEGQVNPQDFAQSLAPSFQMGKEFLEALMKNMDTPKTPSENKS